MPRREFHRATLGIITKPHHLYLRSSRGALLRRLGRTSEARDAYQRALSLAATTAERRFITAGWKACNCTTFDARKNVVHSTTPDGQGCPAGPRFDRRTGMSENPRDNSGSRAS